MKSIFPSVKVLLTCILVAATMSGCAAVLRHAEPPSVTLSNLQVLDAGLFEQRYLLRLRMQNPNAFALPLAGMQYRLEINGKAFARGVTRKPVTIPAYGEEFVDVEVVSDLAGLVEQFKALTGGPVEKVSYRLSGSASLANSLITLPFHYEGNIDLTRGGGKRK